MVFKLALEIQNQEFLMEHPNFDGNNAFNSIFLHSQPCEPNHVNSKLESTTCVSNQIQAKEIIAINQDSAIASASKFSYPQPLAAIDDCPFKSFGPVVFSGLNFGSSFASGTFNLFHFNGVDSSVVAKNISMDMRSKR